MTFVGMCCRFVLFVVRPCWVYETQVLGASRTWHQTAAAVNRISYTKVTRAQQLVNALDLNPQTNQSYWGLELIHLCAAPATIAHRYVRSRLATEATLYRERSPSSLEWFEDMQ